MTVIIAENKEGVIDKLCELIESTAKDSIENHGQFYVGFSGKYLSNLLTFKVSSL